MLLKLVTIGGDVMKESTEQLKEILAGKPDGAVMFDGLVYFKSDPRAVKRSLADIAEIVALREEVERLKAEADEIRAQAVEEFTKDFLHTVANQYDGQDETEWSTGANHMFKLVAKELWKRVLPKRQKEGE